MVFRKGLQVVTAAACLAGLSSIGHAFSIDVDVVDASWVNVRGGGGNLTGEGTNWIRWGNGTRSGGYQQSGYRFDSNGYVPLTVESSESFKLGKFTHDNFPVTGDSIRGAELLISATLSINGQTLGSDPHDFRFRHFESPNQCRPQANCSRDGVRLKARDTSNEFVFNGVAITMSVLGFIDEFGSVRSVLRTYENRSNSAELLAVFNTRIISGPTTLPGISLTEPGLAGILAIFGFTVVALRRRKDSTHS